MCLALIFLAPLPWILFDASPNRFAGLSVGLPIPAAIYSIVALVFLAAFWGLMFRKTYGRWIAVVILILVFFVLLLIWISMAFYPPPSMKPPLSAVVMVSFLVLLSLLLVIRLAFGKKANVFFNEKRLQSPIQAPPPPPSFDS